MLPWLLVPAAYLLGSLNFAWVAGRLNGVDLRTVGSGNLGATNAGRVLGGRWFAFAFAGDVLKGALPVAAARWLLPALGIECSPWLPLAVAAAALIGHVFTCFHGFKGGKAVATSLGVLIALVPLVGGLGFALWTLCWLLGWTVFRMKRSDAVGPASMLATLSLTPIHIALTDHPWQPPSLPIVIFLLLLTALVMIRHRSNIAKLFGRKASAPASIEPSETEKNTPSPGTTAVKDRP